MKFYISRTSSGDDKPHERAYRDKYIRIDTRTVDDPSKLNHPSDKTNWYKQGKNHRVIDGYIKRDFDDEGWFIDIETLDELIKFENETKSNLIIGKCFWNTEINSIEIYDDWRE